MKWNCIFSLELLVLCLFSYFSSCSSLLYVSFSELIWRKDVTVFEKKHCIVMYVVWNFLCMPCTHPRFSFFNRKSRIFSPRSTLIFSVCSTLGSNIDIGFWPCGSIDPFKFDFHFFLLSQHLLFQQFYLILNYTCSLIILKKSANPKIFKLRKCDYL